MQSLVLCFPITSPGAERKPRALEASPLSSLGLLSGSLPWDVSGRLRVPTSISLPRACPKCQCYICWVTACTCTCLPLSSAFCVVLLHCLLVTVVRLSYHNYPSFPLSLVLQNPWLQGQQEVAAQVELKACVYVC